MRPTPAHPVQEDFDFLILFIIIIIIIIYFCNFELFSIILVLENKRDCSPHKSAFLVCVTCSLCLVLDVYVTSCL